MKDLKNRFDVPFNSSNISSYVIRELKLTVQSQENERKERISLQILCALLPMYYPSEAGIAVGAALNIADDFIEKIDKEFQDSIKGINT